MAGDFVDVSNLGNVDKLIDESLTVHLGQYSALVVVPATNISSGTKLRGFHRLNAHGQKNY
jgi:hypothetical protein